jgi:pheromone shutdown-related protein TraB
MPTPIASEADAPMRTIAVGGTTVTLLGTAHVSRQSEAEVRSALAEGGYAAAAVELCQPRFERLEGTQNWEEFDLFQIVRSGRGGMVAAQLALSAYQKRLADQLGVEPGGEMRVAVEAARAQAVPLWLIDRDIGITLRRLVRSVPWYQRWTLITGLLASLVTRSDLEAEDIERLKQGDMLESTFTEFAQKSPALYRVLISERDRYMAAALRARIAEEAPERVLAVVGAGHVAGMAEHLADTDDPASVRTALETLPPRGRFLRIVPWAVAGIILAGFALGFYRSTELGWQLVGDWVLINGTLTALGTALAGGHPLTVITGFVAAPLTSLNPTIGAGMVTGVVETVLRKPRVTDFDRLRDDVTQPRRWWRNRVTRVLLVFVFSTLGSAAATYIGGARIIEQLFG